MTEIADTLKERGNRYGPFTGNAEVSVALKNVLQEDPDYWLLKPFQREALEMICHKIARISNGDPNYTDNWIDIAGYAKLVVDILENGDDGTPA